MTELTTAAWPDRLLTLADWQELPVDELHHVECGEGVLYVTPKPLPGQQRAMIRLAGQLEMRLVSAGLGVAVDSEVLLSESPLTVRAPDVLVVAETDLAANPPRFRAQQVHLAVEILSDGSRRTDRVMKFSEYAEAGIPAYWIVDLDSPVTLSVHVLTKAGGYQLAGEYTGRVTLELAGTTVDVDLDRLRGPYGSP